MTPHVLIVDLYLAVFLCDWFLKTSAFRAHPRIQSSCQALITPYLDWIRRTIRPTWNNMDATRPIGLAALLLLRAILGRAVS